MSAFTTSFYADWRLQKGASISFHETQSPVPERFLQMVWHHQRLLRDQLKTLDGKPIRILHPGFWNSEAGPDFRGAVLKIGDDVTQTGDVEIDLRSDGWRNHGHDRNPNFAKVILHIVWEPDDASKVPAPTLALKAVLDSPINELNLWLESDTAKGFPNQSAGKCCAPLSGLAEEKLTELLQQAAYIRLQRKAHEIQARARQTGWEQALWEGIFRALGYKQNVWPMQRLAELHTRFTDGKEPAHFWQACLFGLSGLLPEPENNDAAYLRKIWDIWWREREMANELIFPKTLWRFNGMRPANLPQRRIALASHWLADPKFFQKLEKWFMNATGIPENSLLKLLEIKEDDFWSWHWTFRSVRLAQPQTLIGPARITDLAINVILPWFWIRAVTGKNATLQKRAEKLYFNWPAAEDNAVLRLARQRLLGDLALRKFPTAASQQGLLQIVKDFCEHSNAICVECRFPDLVRGWNVPSGVD